MYIGQSVGRLGKDFIDNSGFINHAQMPKYTSVIEPLRRYPGEKCFSCLHLKSCYGGCPVLWKNTRLKTYNSSNHIKMIDDFGTVMLEGKTLWI